MHGQEQTGGERDPSYVSHSEARSAQDCGTQWLALWHHRVQRVAEESPWQKVGSLGHAIVAETLLARHAGRAPDVRAAIAEECERRAYKDITEDSPEYVRAVDAAERLMTNSRFNPVAPFLTSAGEPMIERRVRATWAELEARAGLEVSALRLLERVGVEGQPDIVHRSGRVDYVDDYKFRQKVDFGGAVEHSHLPDSQGAFYKILLAAAGVVQGYTDLVFRQIQVYAGPWLTLDDFLVEGSPYVTSNGIPSRDLKVLGMVDAKVWEEAWRALVERRRVASTMATITSKNGKTRPAPVRLASEAETRDAAGFTQALRHLPLVQVSEFRLDFSVCLEVVRDMLAAVAGQLALLRTGATPGRHLRTYPSSPCARRYGCAVQEPCLAALGTGNLRATLIDMAEAGRLRGGWDFAKATQVADYGDDT